MGFQPMLAARSAVHGQDARATLGDNSEMHPPPVAMVFCFARARACIVGSALARAQTASASGLAYDYETKTKDHAPLAAT